MNGCPMTGDVMLVVVLGCEDSTIGSGPIFRACGLLLMMIDRGLGPFSKLIFYQELAAFGTGQVIESRGV